MRWALAFVVASSLAGCMPRESAPQLLVPKEDLQHQSRAAQPLVPGVVVVPKSEVPRHLRAPEDTEVWVLSEDLPRRRRR